MKIIYYCSQIYHLFIFYQSELEELKTSLTSNEELHKKHRHINKHIEEFNRLREINRILKTNINVHDIQKLNEDNGSKESILYLLKNNVQQLP